MTTEQRERVEWIRLNLPTRPRWSKHDYGDFYQRDVEEVLLPLVDTLEAENERLRSLLDVLLTGSDPAQPEVLAAAARLIETDDGRVLCRHIHALARAQTADPERTKAYWTISSLIQQLRLAREFVPSPDDSDEFGQDSVDHTIRVAEATLRRWRESVR